MYLNCQQLTLDHWLEILHLLVAVYLLLRVAAEELSGLAGVTSLKVNFTFTTELDCKL